MSKPFVERNDYHFYSINCKDEDISDFYVGSTTDWSCRRKRHIEYCKKKNWKLYQYINEYGGWDNWYMYKICFQKNLTSMEAFIMETILMKELGSTLNERPAYQSLEEHKKYIAEYHARRVECECGMILRYDSLHKSNHRKSAEHIRRLNEKK